MSPTHRGYPRTSTPDPLSTRSERKSPTSLSSSSSVPSLPDVHKSPSRSQWSFLQTLLAEDEAERQNPGQFHFPDKAGRRHAKSLKSSGEDGDWDHRDKSHKDMAGETLTVRSDKVLTASWTGTRGTVDSGQRGERRRYSRDNTSSPRQVSVSTPFKKKFKPRVNHVSDPKPLPGSRRRFSSPATTTITSGDKSKGFELDPKRGSEWVARSESRQASAGSGRSVVSEKLVSESDRRGESSAARAESQRAATGDRPECCPGASRVTKPGDPDSETVTLPADNAVKRDNREGSQQGRAPLPSSTALTSKQQDNPQSDGKMVNKAATTTTTTATTQNKAPTPSEPISQWTTCRALDDSGDDDDLDDDKDHDDKFDEDQVHSESWMQDAHRTGQDSSSLDGIFSRAASSSNLARRKRPLLLPPIMLPPIYTVKPTPLKLRDELYFTDGEQRARRPISDAEWDKLRDCRYLRIRTLRSIKV